MEPGDNRLSTTALARKLDIPVQQLFVTLKDYGWIQRVAEAWVLTPKGEFEGGQYQKSKRFGRYIVWPGNLDRHPLLAAIEPNKRITAATMCRYYPRLHARRINRALAEIGLQRHSILGWELTEMGRSLGGQQAESDDSGAFFVSWPHEIIDHPVVHRELTHQSDQLAPVSIASDGPEADLFDSSAAQSGALEGIDGHHLQSALQCRVCNWLYLAQLAHAWHRSLPVEEQIYADFYVPQGNVYIDCWEADAATGELSAMLHRREVYRELNLRHIEINASDVDQLDEVLGRSLLVLGIRC